MIDGTPELRYIHRVCGRRHIYHFANTGAETARAVIPLCDRVKLRSFDPHTGQSAPFEAESAPAGTRLNLTLPTVRSLFPVSE